MGSHSYVVVNRKEDLLVYTVKPENKDGPFRTLDRDLLLPCGFLPAFEEEPPPVSNKPRSPNTRQHPAIGSDKQGPEFNSEDEENYQSYPFQDPILTTTRFTQEYEMIMPPQEQFHCSVERTCPDIATVSDSTPETSVETPAGNSTELDRQLVLLTNHCTIFIAESHFDACSTLPRRQE